MRLQLDWTCQQIASPVLLEGLLCDLLAPRRFALDLYAAPLVFMIVLHELGAYSWMVTAC